ncbi:unnamed protein product [Polarella glacialis]|uniref:Uncharacterized protein n=1 Tax=Polarella glacialis TaxID=89957 RepID=A0A813LV36_POLGL|nr:unnamed protein product [Polarella glacialis]
MHLRKACATCLKPGGLLILTSETLAEGESEVGWVERESERFAHCRSYLVRHCEAQGLQVEHVETVELRREQGNGGDEASDTAVIKEDKAKAAPKYLPAEVLVLVDISHIFF